MPWLVPEMWIGSWLDGVGLLRWGSSIACLGFWSRCSCAEWVCLGIICRLRAGEELARLWHVLCLGTWNLCFVFVLSGVWSDAWFDGPGLNTVLDFRLCRTVSLGFGRTLCADCIARESLYSRCALLENFETCFVRFEENLTEFLNRQKEALETRWLESCFWLGASCNTGSVWVTPARRRDI